MYLLFIILFFIYKYLNSLGQNDDYQPFIAQIHTACIGDKLISHVQTAPGSAAVVEFLKL